MKKYDFISIDNALMDVLVKASDEDIKRFNLTKGNMHLVTEADQSLLLSHFEKSEKAMELGGSALNTIRALTLLGTKTVFAGMVGRDSIGQKIKDRFEEIGIISKLRESDIGSGTCVILVTYDGERTMNTYLGSSRLFDEDLVPHDEIKDAKFFHFSGYQWDTEGQKRAINAAINTAKASGTLVSFDVADPFVVGRFEESFRQMIEDSADIVFANEEEAKLLYRSSPEEAADKIARAGAIGVIKLGGKGALISKGDQRIRIDALDANVIDTTGAGDMFAAGFLYGLHRNRDLKKCGEIGTLLASDVISRIGAKVSDEVLDKVASM
ncbi:MAG: adenosine kinase [Oligoflexales bacterium]|nr:adenosine kinase [Oligoflexales bacterium]